MCCWERGFRRNNIINKRIFILKMKTRSKYIWIGIIIAIVLFFLVSQFNKSSVKSTTTESITFSDISFNAFWVDSASCSNLRKDNATMSISFSINNKRINEACKLYVDNKEAGGPLYENIPKSNDYFLGMFEANKDHKARVCCGDVCKDVDISKLCNEESFEVIPEKEPYKDPLSEICKIEPDTCGCPFIANYENDKVAVICEDCGDEEDFLLQKMFEYQTKVYDCLKDNFGYDLNPNAKPILYRFSIRDETSENTVISAGTAYYCGVYNTGFFGVINPGNLRVESLDDLRADVHETAHVFTASLSEGPVPSWFSEGTSIFSANRIQCHSKQNKDFHGMSNSSIQNRYLPLKEGDRSGFINEAHYLGEMFNLDLELNYDCDVNCYFEIVRDLRESCGEVEGCKIDNKKIKKSAEKIIEQDLTELFDLLELDY